MTIITFKTPIDLDLKVVFDAISPFNTDLAYVVEPGVYGRPPVATIVDRDTGTGFLIAMAEPDGKVSALVSQSRYINDKCFYYPPAEIAVRLWPLHDAGMSDLYAVIADAYNSPLGPFPRTYDAMLDAAETLFPISTPIKLYASERRHSNVMPEDSLSNRFLKCVDWVADAEDLVWLGTVLGRLHRTVNERFRLFCENYPARTASDQLVDALMGRGGDHPYVRPDRVRTDVSAFVSYLHDLVYCGRVSGDCRDISSSLRYMAEQGPEAGREQFLQDVSDFYAYATRCLRASSVRHVDPPEYPYPLRLSGPG